MRPLHKLSCPQSFSAMKAAICQTSLFTSPHCPDPSPFYPKHACRHPKTTPSIGSIKISGCQLKTKLTTASFDREACSSARETRIRKAAVSFGHHLVRPPSSEIAPNAFGKDRFNPHKSLLRCIGTQSLWLHWPSVNVLVLQRKLHPLDWGARRCPTSC